MSVIYFPDMKLFFIYCSCILETFLQWTLHFCWNLLVYLQCSVTVNVGKYPHSFALPAQRRRCVSLCLTCILISITKFKSFLLRDKSDRLEIRRKVVHFCTTELLIRLSCSERVSSQTRCLVLFSVLDQIKKTEPFSGVMVPDRTDGRTGRQLHSVMALLDVMLHCQ